MFLLIQLHSTFRKASRKLSKEDVQTRDITFSFFTETLSGVQVIRAFQLQPLFLNKFYSITNKQNRIRFTSYIIELWYHLRLTLLAETMTLCIPLLGVMYHSSASSLALLLAQCATFINELIWFTWVCAYLESSIRSLKRIEKYCTLQTEKYDGKNITEWPKKPSIQFKQVVMRYKPELPPVLKHISFEIFPGEKVGIVGRTGAGKSSILRALFRLTEIEAGKIEIDRQDISSMSLTKLRSSMSIIPQEPVLFSGTLRENVDPFHQFDDQQIWSVLEKVNLKALIEQSPDKLNTKIAERKLIHKN